MPVACGNEFSQAVAPWKFISHHQTWVRTWGAYPNRPFSLSQSRRVLLGLPSLVGLCQFSLLSPYEELSAKPVVISHYGHLTETRTPIFTLKGWPPSQLEDETILGSFLSLAQDESRKEKQHRTPLPCIGDRMEIRTPITSLRGSLPSHLEDTAKLQDK